jgi:ATP-dependent DNA helicase DinG
MLDLDGVKQPTSEVISLQEAFPLVNARPMQTKIIEEVVKAYTAGYRFVILEAPVGSGKSAIAVTLARYFQGSHIITPRKSLQNQYHEDFSDFLVLMKGRSSYPCTYDVFDGVKPVTVYNKVIKIIQNGNSPLMNYGDDHCGNAPCLDDKELLKMCNEAFPCPYFVAVDVAIHNPHIVHNLHSFIFQTSFAGRFDTRPIQIIDEAHEVENMVRDFITKKIVIPKILTVDEEPGTFTTIDEWADWFLKPEFVKMYSNTPAGTKGGSDREIYMARIGEFRTLKDVYQKKFVVRRDNDTYHKRTRFEFIPDQIGQAAHNLLFKYGQKVLLMSGTVYSKEMFCKNLGINPDQAYFIRVGSSFPLESRPIYMKSEYMLDTSHANWTENFPKMIENIKAVMAKFPDVKGLIHAPSYLASGQIAMAVKDPRIVAHDKTNFLQKLEDFLKSSQPKVFISPVCYQGMDFKDDRARFQIIIRVPYPNTNDPFLAYKVKNDYPWFNYQALVTFGQQIGRINRSAEDFGVTILLDARFEKFLSRNKKQIPGWLKEAIIK